VLSCPACSGKLVPILVKSHYGTDVPIDVCNHCGGVWFDEMELFAAKPDEVEATIARAGNDSATRFTNLVPATDLDEIQHAASRILICPRCAQSLGESTAFEVMLHLCPGCGGIWIGKQELIAFKAKQKERIERQRKDAFAAESKASRRRDPAATFHNYFSSSAGENPLATDGTDFATVAEDILYGLLSFLSLFLRI